MYRTLAALTLAGILASPQFALAQDSDGDGVADNVDAWPCDDSVVAEGFFPAEGLYSTLYFEDNWPAAGDFDFNDAVVATNMAARIAPDGNVSSIRVLIRVDAAGGTHRTALRLNLGHSASINAHATIETAGAPPQHILPSAIESELVYTLIPDLHQAFGPGQSPIINVDPSIPHLSPALTSFEVSFFPPIPMNLAAMPFDLHFARSNNYSHQTHLPTYNGTSALNTSLLNTGDDASQPGRYFVTSDGLPFLLQVPTGTPWTIERTSLSLLFPQLIPWAQSGGTAGNRDFYTPGQINHGASYHQAANVPLAPGIVSSHLAVGADLSCTGYVTWKNAVGVTEGRASLAHATGTAAWTQGASSVETLMSGDGYVELKVVETDTYRAFGLSLMDPDQHRDTIDFAFATATNAALGFRESGLQIQTESFLTPGDTLRVEIIGGKVHYLQNAVLRRVSDVVPQYPLSVDVALYSPGASVTEVRLKSCSDPGSACTDLGSTWATPLNVITTATDIVKAPGRTAWNAGASSQATIPCRDGEVETVISETNTSRLFGLGIGDDSASYEDIEFALYPRSDGRLQVWESGRPIVDLGNYYSNDVLAVQVFPTGAVGYYHNGILRYVSTQTVAPGEVLGFDSSLAHPGASLRQVRVFSYNTGC